MSRVHARAQGLCARQTNEKSKEEPAWKKMRSGDKLNGIRVRCRGPGPPLATRMWAFEGARTIWGRNISLPAACVPRTVVLAWR